MKNTESVLRIEQFCYKEKREIKIEHLKKT